ncbi:MAG: tetratricopeptide repeat protein [Catenulisporales bacterium]|nr:tetratricopeptide repeat protein [Catenulisporales bacterium]
MPLGPLKEQLILAILLLESGTSVSARSLADRLWDGEPPATERETLQSHISRLRSRLRAAGDTVGLIRTSRAGAYVLDVPPDVVDARQFDQALTRARATAASDPEAAVALFRQAEALWGGEPLAGLTGQWADGTRRALRERRRSALLARADLELRLGGDPDDLVSELSAWTAVGGVDQAAVGLLMRALARAGRLADALAAYQNARHRLHTELGAVPGPELRTLHRRILNGEPASSPTRRASTVAVGTGASGQQGTGQSAPPPNTLDRDPSSLVGRETELAALLAAVRADIKSSAGGVALFALDGMPGIGKTSLAVRAAHLLAPEALRLLLDEIGAPAREVERAESVDALSALWRRRVHGKRILLLLDDVRDLNQVERLLPTAPGSAALITSRRRLSGLSGLRQHSLRTLPDEAARALLADITERDFADDLDALGRFTARCAGLPLAITVSAAHLRKRPSWSLGDLVARLAQPGHRSADDQITGPVDAAIALSYYSMDALVEHHLIEETARHRYRLHDLIREFALDRAWHEETLDDVEEAVHRAFDLYVRTAERGDRIRRSAPTPDRAPATPTEPIDTLVPVNSREDLRAWLDREAANLTAILAFAAAHNWPHQAPSLLHVLAGHLDRRGHWREAIDLLHRTIETLASSPRPDGTGDRVALVTAARVQTDLAALYTRTGELDQALAHARSALAVYTKDKDQYGRAEATLQTGRIHWLAGRRPEAVKAYRAAAAAFGRVEAPERRANAEYHLGIGLFELGRLDAAFRCVRRALAAVSELGDPGLRCDVLINLGEMHLRVDERDIAMTHFEQARPLAEALGDPQCLAVLATGVGTVHRRSGRYELALAALADALALSGAGADRRNETQVLVQVAMAHIALGKEGTAARQLRQALRLAQDGEDPLQKAHVHLAIGALHLRGGNRRAALDSYTTALSEAESAQALLDQAHALRAIGELLAPEEPAESRRYLTRAEAVYQRLGRRGATLASASII